jgi:hypothetical protein
MDEITLGHLVRKLSPLLPMSSSVVEHLDIEWSIFELIFSQSLCWKASRMEFVWSFSFADLPCVSAEGLVGEVWCHGEK